jgi:RNA polymerase sigma-70 factor (ECF subfamily)
MNNLGTPAKPQHRPGSQASAEFLRQLEEEIPFLRQIARRWYRANADAEDLVQETLVYALADAQLWQPDSELRAWLFRVMRNRFLKAAAKSKRLASAQECIAATPLAPVTNTGELRLIFRDLYAALRRLPDSQRSAVILIGIEGKSYAAAAQRMGISVGAVRSHLMRGRDRLKAAVRGTEARLPFATQAARTLPAAVPNATLPALVAAGSD